jgi:hypothetical protein
MEEQSLIVNFNPEFIDDENNAEAAVSFNPFIQWAKIVVTDDLPNLNNQRVPEEEFANIINTGVNTPIKMTPAQASKNHKDAMGKVIGVISQLVQEGNKIIALAAFWKRERPNDIELLKEMFKSGNPPNVSWELSFANSEKDNEGIETLRNIALNGLAIVSNPAYAGRTPFVAMASEEQEDSRVEELEKIQIQLDSVKTELAAEQEKLNVVNSQLEEKDKELDELRKFKEEIETAKAEVEKFDAVKKLFHDAGLEKDAEYFDKNKEMLLGLSESALEFIIQEMVSFKEASAENKSNKQIKIPDFKGSGGKLDPKELGRSLRENK